MHPWALYPLATAVFFGLDMLWLGIVAKNLYSTKLAFIYTGQINWAAAIAFYLVYIAGILYFAVLPQNCNTWPAAALNGAVLGLLCYATYDLTNMATIPQWPLLIVVVDIIWGAVLTGAVAAITVAVGVKWGIR